MTRDEYKNRLKNPYLSQQQPEPTAWDIIKAAGLMILIGLGMYVILAVWG